MSIYVMVTTQKIQRLHHSVNVQWYAYNKFSTQESIQKKIVLKLKNAAITLENLLAHNTEHSKQQRIFPIVTKWYSDRLADCFCCCCLILEEREGTVK